MIMLRISKENGKNCTLCEKKAAFMNLKKDTFLCEKCMSENEETEREIWDSSMKEMLGGKE